jgi:cysteine synthase A
LTTNFEIAEIDEAFTISDEESLHMALFLAQNEGLLLGGSSAMNCVAIVKVARKYPKLK